MKSYSMLSGRYLKQQRRRSLLTALGIMLSTALISALLTMGQAVKDNVILQQMYEDGSFHFGYTNADSELYERMEDHALVDRVGVKISGAETKLKDLFSVYVSEVNQDALELLPIHLKDGRLPASPDEVAVEEWIMQHLPGKPKLNDRVSLAGPDGEPHLYEVTGILENQKYSQMAHSSNAYTLMDASAPNPAPGSNMELYVTLKTGTDISSQLPEFAKLNDSFGPNQNVLTLMGESSDNRLNQALMVIFGTLVSLVVLSTVAVIYNAFHISVLERIRQFGLLRTIGATPRQIRHLVFKEAGVLAIFAIPLGLAIGWGILWLVLWLMVQSGFRILQMDEFRLTFHWWIMGLSVCVGTAAVYLAAWLPAHKASKVSPVEAVKGAGSIVRESYRRARLPSPLRLLGIEGKMASNNIRRNRTKFRITTFSIVISIVLFIVFHYFTRQAFDMTVDQTENNKIAFELTRHMTPVGSTEEENVTPEPVKDIVSEDTREKIAGLPGVEGVYGKYDLPSAGAVVPDNLVNPEFPKISGTEFDKVSTRGGLQGLLVPVYLQLYDDGMLSRAARFLEAGTLDPKKLTEEDGVVIIQTVKPYNADEDKKEIVPLTRFKVGDTIALQLGNDPNNEKSIKKVKVAGILSQSSFESSYMSNMLTVIGTHETMTRLIEAAPPENRPYGTALMGLAVAMKDGADSEPVRLALEQIAADIPGGQLIDIEDMQKESRQFALQMQIFIYGFLAVIGLIGSLNIINTVQTNLLLRRREIGLLQAVGMTMGQIRKMATAEGVWFGVIGSFWGLVIGGAVSYFLFVKLSGIQGMPFEFPWGGALIACAVAMCVGLISVQGPLRRMSKANLIEELREDV